MEKFAVDLLVFCMIAMAGLLATVAIQAFQDPSEFVKWFRPFYWLTRKAFRTRQDRLDTSVAWFFGGFCLIFLIVICFTLGSFFTTTFFSLWLSPISDFVLPR